MYRKAHVIDKRRGSGVADRRVGIQLRKQHRLSMSQGHDSVLSLSAQATLLTGAAGVEVQEEPTIEDCCHSRRSQEPVAWQPTGRVAQVLWTWGRR
jgi:hypothetical protein